MSNKEELREEYKEIIEQAKNRLACAKAIAWILALLLFFGGSVIPAYGYSYERTVEKTVKEPYEHVVDTVSTYVCYTTTYGDCYHAKGCQYLWNSANKTTVYEAKQKGYGDCSRCIPMQRTTLELTETRYRDVTKEVTETIDSGSLLLYVWGFGYAVIVALYVGFVTLTKRKIQDAENGLKHLDVDMLSQLVEPLKPAKEIFDELSDQFDELIR